ncbi:MAG: signal transduction histidine kinase [Rhodothermales bacterium]
MVKLRSQLLTVMLITVLLPLGVLLLAVRVEMGKRLTGQHAHRVSQLIGTVTDDLRRERDVLDAAALSAVADLRSDTQLRRALAGDSAWVPALPAIGRRTLARARLDVLLLLDADGSARLASARLDEQVVSVPLSDGSMDWLEPSETPIVSIIPFSTGFDYYLVRSREVLIDSVAYQLQLGRVIDDAYLNGLVPDSSMTAGLISESRLLAGSSVSGLTRDIPAWVRAAGETAPREAALRIAHRLGELEAILGSLDRWLLAAFGFVALATSAGAWWIAGRFTRPITQLAESTASIELLGTGSRFLARRRDEIGSLSRTLDAMVKRLRASAAGLQKAERRATLGDFARQANHDIKNGLTPIKNVFVHLNEVAGDAEELKRVFGERRGSVESGIDYLGVLATEYARISTRTDIRQIDVTALAREAVSAAGDSRVRFSGTSSMALADPLAIRRIVENLVTNGLDSLVDASGRVDVLVEPIRPTGGTRLSVSDTGTGIPPELHALLFQDFYTTKENGIGLGLSIVRRLVLDMNGELRVESVPGEGSSFVIELPALGH